MTQAVVTPEEHRALVPAAGCCRVPRCPDPAVVPGAPGESSQGQPKPLHPPLSLHLLRFLYVLFNIFLPVQQAVNTSMLMSSSCNHYSHYPGCEVSGPRELPTQPGPTFLPSPCQERSSFPNVMPWLAALCLSPDTDGF